MPKIKNLECSRCKKTVPADQPQTLCPECKGALYVRYDLSHLHGVSHRDKIAVDAAQHPWLGMWRYKSVLPDAEPGEGLGGGVALFSWGASALLHGLAL